MPELPLTRQSLLIDLADHSDAAWAEFLEIYETAIFAYCKSRGLQDADASDATQVVFTAIHQKLPDWDLDQKKGSFRAWIFRVARNVSVDMLTLRGKSAAKGGTQSFELMSQVHDHRANASVQGGNAGQEPDSTAFQLELKRALFDWASSQVQAEARHVTWQAFSLTAIEGWSPEKVARELEISIGSVYTAKCRIMARIRQKVELWHDLNPDHDAMHWRSSFF